MILSAIMRLNAAGFTGPLSGVTSGLGGTIAKIAALTGVTLTLAGAIAGVKGALDLGGSLSDLSASTGVAIRDLVVLKQAFQDTGVGADSTGVIIRSMQRAIGGVSEDGQPTAKIFQQIGLSLDALKRMSPDKQITAIGGAIRGLNDPAQQTAAAMAIFGRSGAMMKSFFADPAAIDTARKSLGGLPEIMQRNAGLFDSVSDSLGRIRGKATGLWAGVAEGIAPALKSVTDRLDAIDLSGLGRRIGEGLAIMGQAVRDGRIGELLGLSLKIGFANAVNFLVGALKTTVDVGFAYLRHLPRLMVEEFKVLANPTFWQGIAQIAIGAFMGLGGVLLKVFMTPLTYLQAGMDTVVDRLFARLGSMKGVGKLLGLENYGKARSFDEHLADRQANGFFLKNTADDAVKLSGEQMAAGLEKVKSASAGLGAEVVDTLGDMWAQLKSFAPADIIDKSEWVRQFGDIVGQLKEKVDANRTAVQEQFAAAPMATGDARLRGGEGGGGKMEIASDRLARIGLFVGASGPMLDASKRTASAAERTARGVDKLVGLTERGGPQPAAVWAA